jgi:outer membrane protein TolC
VTADYGAIGLHISSALPTFSIVGALSVPIFEAGACRAGSREADSELRTRRAQAEDAKRRSTTTCAQPSST